MEIHWPDNIQEARKIQIQLKELYSQQQTNCHIDKIEFIAGVDASYTDKEVIAGCTLFKLIDNTLTLIEKNTYKDRVNFPYIPGFLSFREGKVIVETINQLTHEPDVILVDGQGIAHPYGVGIATHIGIVLNKRTIGCAKSLLIGKYEEPSKQAISYSLIYNNFDETIGAAIRTKSNAKVIFVSPGYKIALQDSIEIIIKCLDKSRNYRLPIPIRLAHILSKQEKNRKEK